MKNFHLPAKHQKKHSLPTAFLLLLSLFVFAHAAKAKDNKAFKKHGHAKSNALNSPILNYNTPQQYAINQSISPLAPTGNGVAAVAYSSTALPLTGSYSGGEAGAIVDAAGNIYVVDPSRTMIDEIPANGGAQFTIASGFTFPNAMAVDKSGNVYVADSNTGQVVEILAKDRSVAVITTSNTPQGIAVDAAGNVYVPNSGTGVVKKFAPDGTSTTVASGFYNPTGLAVDAVGNLYVADYGLGAVKQVAPNGTITTYIGSPEADISRPTRLAVDAAGNLFIGDQGSHQVVMIPQGNGTPVVVGPVATPSGVAVDTKGVVYIGDNTQGTINTITPAGGYYLGNALPAGLCFSSSTGVISGTPTTVTPAADYLITAYNSSGGTSTTLNIAILPIIVNLSALNVSAGTLSPAFAKATTGYTDSVSNATTSISVTPSASPGSNVTVNGTAVTSGSASAAIALTAGSNTISIVVTGSDGTTTQTYTVNVVRAPSTVALLSGLSVATATLSPAFASGVFVYYAVVPASTNTVTITPSLVDSTASITVNGKAVANKGTSIPLQLISNGQTLMTIIVTAQDGVTINKYNIVIGQGTDATLSALNVSGSTLSPAFAPGTTSYSATYSIIGQTTSITVTPTVNDPAATVTINGTSVTPGSASGPITISEGQTTVINVVVTAADGKTTQTYTINAIVSPSGNAYLVSINPSVGPLTPAFNTNTTDYTINVKYSVATMTVKPITSDANAVVTLNGIRLTSGTVSAPISLDAGGQTYVRVTVTAQNKTTIRTYTIAVTRAPGSTNDNLSNITLSRGDLAPAFDPGTTAYADTVTNSTGSLTLTPTAADPTATITVNGTTVVPGKASGAIALAVGNNIITTVVTAQDGSTQQTFTVDVLRPSTNAKLSGLTISAGKLSPAFASATTSYTVTEPYTQSSVVITPTVTVSGAKVTVNGTAVTSGTASGTISLSVGVNNIPVLVTAQDGVTTETYTLTVTRSAASTNDNLSNMILSKGTLTPAFTSGTATYSAMVTNGTTSITLTPTTADATATVTVNGMAVTSGKASGAIALAVGANSVATVVTAQDGVTTQTYIVNVIRPSTNAKLAGLTLNAGKLAPAFNGSTNTYTVTETYTQSSVEITPTVAVTGATVTVNGTTVASGKQSTAIALSVGSNTITTVVTAQDGVTTDTYTLNVTRAAASTNDYLANIVLNKGTLTPAFTSSTTSYSSMQTNGTTSVTLTPTAADATATITVNGTAVASGKASGAIALAVGSNNIATVVTAQDGVTRQTYTVTVIRPSTNAKLSALTISSGTLSPAFNTNTTAYAASVLNTTETITVTPTIAVAGATVTVNGTLVASGNPSAAIALAVGSNTITTVVTAQDGTTTDTYTLTVTRALSGVNNVYEPVSVDKPAETPQLADDGITVHQAISPNGDGINDFLQIDNISQSPDNKLSIMDRNGRLVFEAKGYDNATKVFDGHSNKTGQMQLPGTYFYELDYTVNGITKHKTGYLVLKY